jgi:DNA-directed RNA polymerase specialized sigma24 family protein
MNSEDSVLITKYLKALLAVQLRQSGGETDSKPELILSSAGLPVKEIADILGKNVAAVTKTIQRGGKSPTKRERS